MNPDLDDLRLDMDLEDEQKRSAINTALFFQRANKQIGCMGKAKFGPYTVNIGNYGTTIRCKGEVFRFYKDRK